MEWWSGGVVEWWGRKEQRKRRQQPSPARNLPQTLSPPLRLCRCPSPFLLEHRLNKSPARCRNAQPERRPSQITRSVEGNLVRMASLFLCRHQVQVVLILPIMAIYWLRFITEGLKPAPGPARTPAFWSAVGEG
jgi:hypothetical protein